MSTNHEPYELERRHCRDCGAVFTLSPQELRWIEARGWQPYRRCAACRGARRAAEAEGRQHGHAGMPALRYR